MNGTPGQAVLAPSNTPPTLTLCLIARDEEVFLPDCLRSSAFVDEVIVVDTGSTDRTADIARQRHATVVTHDWDDDFAAARNVALEHATGDWVLVLDADERLAPGAEPEIRAAMAREDLDCGLLPLHNASHLEASEVDVIEGRARRGLPVLLPRLLRKVDGLRWQGRVHEDLDTWLGRRLDRVHAVQAPIVHLGALASVRAAKSKDARNLRLLKRRCAEEPDHLQTRVHLGHELAQVGDLAGAWEVQEEAWRLQHLRLDAMAPQHSWVPVTSLRLHLQVVQGDVTGLAETLQQSDRWSARHPHITDAQVHPDLMFHRGLCAELLASGAVRKETRWQHLGDAAQAYSRLWQLDGVQLACESEVGVMTWRRAVRLGTVLLQLGHGERGRAKFSEALGHRPSSLRAALGLAEAALCLGEWEVAAAHLQGLHGALDTVDVHVLDACLAVARGAWSTVAVALEAAAVCTLPTLEPHRRRLIQQLSGCLDCGTRPGDAPVFIGGAGRSGTTLLRAMLHAHPHLYAPSELKVVPELMTMRDRWRGPLAEPLAEAGLERSDLDAAVRALLDTLFAAITPPGHRLVEKTPHDVLHIEALATLYPRARFVHCVRDGRAVATSLVKQPWVDPVSGQPIAYCANLTAAADYWAEVVQRARQESAGVLGRVLQVRYEQLVADPEAVMRRVLAFLGEDWDPAVLHPERSGAHLPDTESSSEQAKQPVHTRAVDRWRSVLSDDEQALLQSQIGYLLGDLGYA